MHIDEVGLLSLGPNDLIGHSIAVLGVTGSGKSNTAAVLIEESAAAGIPFVVVDIAGEYHTLREAYPNVTTVGRSLLAPVQLSVTPANAAHVAATAYLGGKSVVLDISGYSDHDSRAQLLLAYFGRIWELSAAHRIPLLILIEECHNWMPQGGKTMVSELLVSIAAEGRKRGLSMVLVGQRSARIDKNTLTQTDLAFLHKVRHPVDLKVYEALIPWPPSRVRDSVSRLAVGEALVLHGDKIIRCAIRRRHTTHVGFTPGLANVPATQMSLLDLMNGGK